MMRKFVTSLLLLVALMVFVSGCFPKEEKATEEAVVEKVKEHPAPDAPPAPSAPKDHPAH